MDPGQQAVQPTFFRWQSSPAGRPRAGRFDPLLEFPYWGLPMKSNKQGQPLPFWELGPCFPEISRMRS